MTLKKILAAPVTIIIAIMAMILLSYISFSRVQHLNRLSALVNHTHVVQMELHKTYSRLRDAGSELNSFLLTKDSAYYIYLMDAEAEVKTAVAGLKNLTLENPLQNKKVKELDSLIHVRYSYMTQSLNATDGVYTLFSRQITQCNKALTALIRDLIEE